MKRRNRNKMQQSESTPGAMLAACEAARVIRGGKEVELEDLEQLRAAYHQGLPVLPPRMVMLDDKAPEKPSPAATVLDKLVRDGRLSCFLNAFFKWPSADGLGNAHEVAMGLMIDLMMARQSDGWVWVRGDLKGRGPCRDYNHSWLEYQGWAVDAACGLVRIWPSWWYRSTEGARRLILRDAAQTREMLRSQGGGALIDAIDARVPEAAVHVYDFATRRVATMPTNELAPGMALAKVQGVDGHVWVDMTQAKPGTNYFHPSFPPETRRQIAWIADVLKDVHPLSLHDWEDGFRRDLSADRQIFIHTCIAEAFKRFTEGGHMSVIQKRELYHAIVQATLSTREAFAAVVSVAAVSRTEAIQAGDLFWRVFNERNGVEKCRQWNAETDKRLRALRSRQDGTAA